MPISVDKVQVRPFSTCITFKEERVTSGETDIAVESISGFVACLRDGQWWLACVLQMHVENSRVKLTFLHPHGPSNSFKYPAVQDIHTVPVKHVLGTVDPRTRTGRTYTLLKKETKFVSEKLCTILAEN